MTEIKYKFDYTEPENVESEVPGTQKLRESPDDSAIDKSTEWDENNIETSEDYVLAPVVTVTKNEATFTKGDMRLQKVSVTENIAEIRNGIFHTIKAPTYPPIYSDVIHQSPIRMEPNGQLESKEPSSRPIRSLEKQMSQPEERRTRIPTRFKNAVNRVRRDRSMPAKKVNEALPTHPRRSSIPRLKPKTPPPKPEEEFERLYGEISNSPTDIDISILNSKVEDPEKVEYIFEEIIHAYDENKIQPIVVETTKYDNKPNTATVEKPKSKIPMLKRKSEVEIDVLKSVQANAKSGPVVNTQFKDAVSKFTKADTNEPKAPSRIAVTKRENVENDHVKLKTSFQRLKSVSRDGPKHKLHVENVVKVSIEQDISPDNVVNIDDVGASAQSSIEIVELTPEPIDFENQIIAQPYTVETVESPSISIVEEVQNNVLEIEEAMENEPTTEVNEADNTVPTKILVEPVKVVSKDEFQKLLLKHAKGIENVNLKTEKPVEESNKNGAVESNGYEIGNYARENSVEKEIVNASPRDWGRKVSTDNDEIKSPVLRKTVKPDSREEKNGEDDIVIQHKSVLSKIALFEKQKDDQTHLKPKPAVRCAYRRKLLEEQVSRNTENPQINSIINSAAANSENKINNDAVDITKPDVSTSEIPKPQARRRNINPNPIIACEVIKPNDPDTQANDPSNNTKNEVLNDEINNNIMISENLGISKMEIKTEEVAVSLAIEENVLENQTISEITEDVPFVNTTKDRLKRRLAKRYSFEVDYAQEKPLNIEQAEEREIISLTPVEIEYEEPVNHNGIKINDNKAQDPVVVSHIYKSTYVENESKESPFDFTPKTPDYKSSNYKISPTMSSEEILNAYRARTEDYDLRKTKSVAELDLGDAVKGKVKDLIVRMKSLDKGVEKREVISAKERPRKKSVSEKIALFEAVHVTATVKHVELGYARREQQRVEEAKTEAQYNRIIEELEQAKQTYGQTDNMASVTLSNGEVMPALAVGTALLDPRLAPHIVATAIDLGYRAIDTAFIYGNEKEVGQGIKKKIDDGTVKRSDLFVIAKLWSTFHRRDLVEEAYKQSLERLGLDYVDLYLVHNPMSFKEGGDPIPKIAQVVQFSEHDFLDAWFGMEDLVAKGLVKSIGLSNFNSSQVQKILDKARVKPVINQVECHPYLSQQRLYNFCDERAIKLSCFGVLGSKGTPAEFKNSTVSAIDDPLVKVMAAGLKVSPAQLLIRYQLQSDHAVVVKASTGAHMWDNLQALNFELTEGQMDALRALNRNKRTFTFKGMGDTHKNYPFNTLF